MRIALLSDTHDNMEKVKKFVEEVKKTNPDYIIHLGDIVSPFVIPFLSILNLPGIVVKGNNDGDTDYLGEMCYNAGFEFVIPPHRFKLEGKRFVLSHRPIKNDFNFTGVDFYFYGHTHYAEIKRKDGLLIVNPGTLSGYVSGESSYALVDTITGDVKLQKL